jgi:flagellar export protein FliJ
MTKFAFSLEALLKHRKNIESQAELLVLQKQTEINAVDFEIGRITLRRSELIGTPQHSIAEFKEREFAVARLDDAEREQQIIRGVLSNEVAVLRAKWVVAKQDLEVVEKLREKAFDAWRLEMDRLEQRELDEWATQRRAA